MRQQTIDGCDLEHAKLIDSFDPGQYPRAKAAFGYYGCKQKVSSKLLDLLPPHSCWVELFCGSAAITLAKVAAPIEIINDIDGNIVNVFKQLRKSPTELIRAIELTPYAREEFLQTRNDNVPQCDMERARRFLVEAMMSINGVLAGNKGGFSYSNSYSRSGNEARVNRWKNFPNRLSDVANRLRDVRIENLDAVKLLEKFVNRPATLVYIDPPYLIERNSGYVNDAKESEFHVKLLELCNRAKCMILISGYENPVYEEFLCSTRGWKKEIICTHTTPASGKKLHREEVVWINKVAAKASTTNRIPIRLTKKERLQKKVNPTRG